MCVRSATRRKSSPVRYLYHGVMVDRVGTFVSIVSRFSAANTEMSGFPLRGECRFNSFLFDLGRSSSGGGSRSGSGSRGAMSGGRGSGGRSCSDGSSVSLRRLGSRGGTLSFGFADFFVDAVVVRSTSAPSCEISGRGYFVEDTTKDGVLESFLVQLDSGYIIELCQRVL